MEENIVLEKIDKAVIEETLSRLRTIMRIHAKGGSIIRDMAERIQARRIARGESTL